MYPVSGVVQRQRGCCGPARGGPAQGGPPAHPGTERAFCESKLNFCCVNRQFIARGVFGFYYLALGYSAKKRRNRGAALKPQ